MNWDIYLCYRRQDGRDYARLIYHALKELGYSNIFFDYDSLCNGIDFSNEILKAIQSCKDFIFVMTPLALMGLSRENDWIARELRIGINHNCHIIPVVPEGTFKGWPEDIPSSMLSIRQIQFSELYVGDYFDESINMIARRLWSVRDSIPKTNSFVDKGKCGVKSLELEEQNLKEYDVFISYRRKDKTGNIAGRDIARGFKHYLESKGFSCFFDYSECDDGEFEDIIIPAVGHSKYLLLVMTNGALDRCIDERDWVRREFCEAFNKKLKIVPIAITDNEHPEISFHGIPPSLPYPLIKLESIQWSEVSMGSLYEVSVDLMIKRRLNKNK